MRCDWNLAETQFEIVLENFSRIEIGLRKFFLSKEEREGECGLKIICPSKEGE